MRSTLPARLEARAAPRMEVKREDKEKSMMAELTRLAAGFNARARKQVFEVISVHSKFT